MIELVWDTGRVGTATSPTGATMSVGDRTPFSPDDLLATAVAGCVMRTFLRLVGEAGQPILSYAATAHAAHTCDAGGPPRMVVHAYVLAPAGADPQLLADLAVRSALLSPVSQLLALRPEVTSDVRVLCHSDPSIP